MLFMGFEGMAEPSKRISFGTAAERPTFPSEIAHDRFGNEMNPFRGVKEVGPGQYDNAEHTTFTNMKQPISSKGYVLGARTAQREYYQLRLDAPSPTHYQNSINRQMPKPSFKPFNNSADRFRKESLETVPGPGHYEHNVVRNRNVQMLHSFGGRTKSVPNVDIQCIVNNGSIICENCNQAPVGDYYHFKTSVLCTRCYEYNHKWQEKYSRAYLSSFKKTRDCSFIHEHQGTSAAIQKMSDKEIRKLKQKEAYLSLYWD